MNFGSLLRGPSKRDTVERYIIAGLLAGVAIAGAGILSTIFATKGLPTAVTLIGSFITFISTVILVLFWFFADGKKTEG